MFTKEKWLALCIGIFLVFPFSSGAAENEKGFYASKVLEFDVFDSEGKNVGEIDDFVIRRSGLIKSATFQIGGWIGGLGSKLVAYPLSELIIEENRLVVKESEEELHKREQFNYYDRRLSQEYFYKQYNPYERPRLGYRYGRGPAYRHQWSDPVLREEFRYEEGPRHRFYPEIMSFSPARFLASVVIGRSLIDPMGAKFGIIRDLFIERNNVEKLILEATVLDDGVHVALPYERLGFTDYGIAYEITLEELKRLERVDYGM